LFKLTQNLVSLLTLCFLLPAINTGWAQEVDVAKLSFNKPVIDTARIFSQSEEQSLNLLLSDIKGKGLMQAAVVTLPSLNGGSIEDISIRITDAWKLGTAKEDKGLLITLAIQDRKMRIEVGQGLEGDIPDAYANRVIDLIMTPEFRANRFAEGTFKAIVTLAQRVDPTYTAPDGSTRNYQRQRKAINIGDIPWWGKILGLLCIMFLIFTRSGRQLLMVLLYSAAMSGGRGGGSSGGGGYSGGGGGFSGGGSSGGW